LTLLTKPVLGQDVGRTNFPTGAGPSRAHMASTSEQNPGASMRRDSWLMATQSRYRI
jgi:hypothetical protein